MISIKKRTESYAPSAYSSDFRQVINQAKEKVFPAVVFIKCIRESYEGGRRQTAEVLGSGVLIDPEGRLLTNWHVVGGESGEAVADDADDE